ncbi:MAG TPA: glutamine--tRNA ligase, partial [Bacteroidales bacterium]|nr:glutamine--tRNA ligase [Bacteroidales bacterium]
EVRLKYAYIIKCTHIVKDEDGNIVEIHATYDPETKSGMAQSNRKVKATIHWLSTAHALPAEVRLFDKLFTVPEPDNTEEGKTFLDYINPDSLIVKQAFIEKCMENESQHPYYQFERIGYFCVDSDSTKEKLVFNKTVGLKS